MSHFNDAGEKGDSVRARKRRETLQRLTDAGMRLFIEKGVDATTIDEIASAAGRSRRTFFYYFKSKDDILLSMQSGMGEMIVAGLREMPNDMRPLAAVRQAIIQVCAPFPAEDMIAIDRLMHASEVVQARKQASYVQHEQTLFAALRDKWPEPDREVALRLVAMLAIGATRLAIEALNREGGKRPIEALLNEAFGALDEQLHPDR